MMLLASWMQEMLVRGLPDPRTEHKWMSRLVQQEARLMLAGFQDKGGTCGLSWVWTNLFSVAAIEHRIEKSPDEIVPGAVLAGLYKPMMLALEYKPSVEFGGADVRRRAKVQLTGLRKVILTTACSRRHRQGLEDAINVTLQEGEVEVSVARLKVAITLD